MEEYSLTDQRVIIEMYRLDRLCPPPDLLARRLRDVTVVAVKRALTRLETRGFVVLNRGRQTGDKRSTISFARLTRKARIWVRRVEIDA